MAKEGTNIENTTKKHQHFCNCFLLEHIRFRGKIEIRTIKVISFTVVMFVS